MNGLVLFTFGWKAARCPGGAKGVGVAVAEPGANRGDNGYVGNPN